MTLPAWVTVWSVRSIEQWREYQPEPLPQKDRRSCATACSCPAGEKHVRNETTGKAPTPRGAAKPRLFSQSARYDPRYWCLAKGGTLGEMAYQAFDAWCQDYYDRKAAAQMNLFEDAQA